MYMLGSQWWASFCNRYQAVCLSHRSALWLPQLWHSVHANTPACRLATKPDTPLLLCCRPEQWKSYSQQVSWLNCWTAKGWDHSVHIAIGTLLHKSTCVHMFALYIAKSLKLELLLSSLMYIVLMYIVLKYIALIYIIHSIVEAWGQSLRQCHVHAYVCQCCSLGIDQPGTIAPMNQVLGESVCVFPS